MLDHLKWLFFDVGSTLVDESKAIEHRIRNAIAGSDVTYEEFCAKSREFYEQNKKGDLEAIRFFGLTKTKWHKEDEFLYPQTAAVLKKLSEKYKLGVIANQSSGTCTRLEQWGILKYFDVVAASAEEGVAKPDTEIFLRALSKADCSPTQAAMIGDRLDNDIAPAKSLGMTTVWVMCSNRRFECLRSCPFCSKSKIRNGNCSLCIKQGMGRYQTPVTEREMPDFVVEDLTGLCAILV